MSELKVKYERLKVKGLLALLCTWYLILCPSCNPEAPWSTRDVELYMTVGNISAGFIECNFSTNKEAYYLIGLEPARPGYDPMTQQKQFMTLELDEANVAYLSWRNLLLQNGEFNIAPFSSQSLQYGNVHYIFTGLEPDTEYWLYAFVVNPDKMEPVGHLYMMPVSTTAQSTMNIHFEYRVKGKWDYSYPLDSAGKICTVYPYIAATRDSLEIDESGDSPEMYFGLWYGEMMSNPEFADILYGVKAVENDGFNSYLEFEAGHTYYTYFSGFEGSFNHQVLYKFRWEGENTSLYFREEDSVLDDTGE